MLDVQIRNIARFNKNQRAWALLQEWGSVAKSLLATLPKNKRSGMGYDSLVIRPLYTRGGRRAPVGVCWQIGKGFNTDGTHRGQYVIAISMHYAMSDEKSGLDTLVHELAHVFDHWENGKSDHGEQWQKWYITLRSQVQNEKNQ